MFEPVFTKELLADGSITCYRFRSTGEEASEAWFSEVDDLFSNWDGSKPLLTSMSRSVTISSVQKHCALPVTSQTSTPTSRARRRS